LADSDMAAVVSTSGASSGLTRDRAKLQEAITKTKVESLYRHVGRACPDIGYYEADRIKNKHDPMALDAAVDNTLACCDCARNLAQVLVDNAAAESLQIGDQDIRVTLGLIREIVRKMSGMPGERTLLLVSPGFLTMTPDALAGKSQILDLAAQGNVTINAVDARGLYTAALDASDRNRGSARSERTASEYKGYSMALNEDVMAELAAGTGGTYFHNSNDLEGGLRSLAAVPEYVARQSKAGRHIPQSESQSGPEWLEGGRAPRLLRAETGQLEESEVRETIECQRETVWLARSVVRAWPL